MKLLRHITTLLLTLPCAALCAADFTCLADSAGIVRSATSVWYGRERGFDEYLSPLTYQGWTTGIGNESDKLIVVNGSPCLRQYWHWRLGYGQLRAMSGYNGRRTWFVNAGWRLMHEWRFKGVTLSAGGMVAADYAGRYVGNNVNKPYSMDLAIDLSLAAGIRYGIWAGKKVHFTFDYHVSTPFIGCFFMPDMGQAYYEFEQGLKGSAHFASFHNRLMLNHDFHIDMRLQRTAWRIGIRHAYLRCRANGLEAQREDLHAYVGWLADLDIRRGTRKR